MKEETKKPIVSPGSLLNSSEGLTSGGSMAALVGVMQTSDAWQVQACACIGLALVSATYCVMRSKAKAPA